jgi:hypothetical protein
MSRFDVVDVPSIADALRGDGTSVSRRSLGLIFCRNASRLSIVVPIGSSESKLRRDDALKPFARLIVALAFFDTNSDVKLF